MRQTRNKGDSRKYFDWLEIAARDLLAARILLQNEQCLEIAGFHCQQGMEKTLKAFILFRSRSLVDGHNLTWLCRRAAKDNPAFSKWLGDISRLNRLYIETRYPSDIEINLRAEFVETILEMAQMIYDYTCEQVYADAKEEK